MPTGKFHKDDGTWAHITEFNDLESITATNVIANTVYTVSYTHLRAHETVLDIVCRLLLEKKKQKNTQKQEVRTRKKKNVRKENKKQ